MPKKTKKYRYFKTVDLDEKGNEVGARSIHRASHDFVEVSRYDHVIGKWVPNTALSSAIGMGGDNPYDEIDEKEAIAIMKKLVN